MLKSEIAILEVLKGAKTQKEIANKMKISLSTVNHALKPLERIGAIEKRKFGFKLIDKEKALVLLATQRNLEKDVIYKTRAEMPVSEIEKQMPSEIIFTAYTAYKLNFKQVPADYSEVYIYADEKDVPELKKRFPEKDGPANLIVLSKPKIFFETKFVSNYLLFVDLWNLKEWYAKEFLKSLKQKIGLEQ
ncbi:MAG: winged helix-turn-helix domain-containing protein [Candidatus Diapherotrites archaeon]